MRPRVHGAHERPPPFDSSSTRDHHSSAYWLAALLPMPGSVTPGRHEQFVYDQTMSVDHAGQSNRGGRATDSRRRSLSRSKSRSPHGEYSMVRLRHTRDLRGG